MKNKRGVSFLILFFVYAVAFSAAWLLCGRFMEGGLSDVCNQFLFIDVAATVIVFVFSVIFGNASVYDPYWSIQPIVFVTAAAVIHGVTAAGAAVLVAVWFWGLRLTANWAYTFHGLAFQDWRYTLLKEKTKWFYPVVNFFGIHMIPTLVVFCCMMPAVDIIHSGFSFRPRMLTGIFISLAGATLQGIADIQMHRFKKHGGKGFIRTGLWKKGRHPNYLGEILMWWGVAVTWLLSSPDMSGWQWMVLGAVLNTCLFLFISIPLADNHQARKPGFAGYKKETRLFI